MSREHPGTTRTNRRPPRVREDAAAASRRRETTDTLLHLSTTLAATEGELLARLEEVIDAIPAALDAGMRIDEIARILGFPQRRIRRWERIRATRRSAGRKS